MSLAASAWFLPLSGLFAGIVMGFAARRHHFCTLSALERHWYAGDSRGVRTWVLAAASALAFTQALMWYGLAEPERSFYLGTNFAWAGAVLGGLAFGFGMALVGTCGFGALVRAGGGSLRSVVVLMVLGLTAMATQRGMFAHFRLATFDTLAIDLSFAQDQSIGSVVSALTGHDLHGPLVVVTGLLLLMWIFRDEAFRKQHGRILAAVVIGGAVAFGWAITTYASHHSFDPVHIKSASFVMPVADTILHFAIYTGAFPDYAVWVVLGVLVGAAICAWSRKDVRWEACDDARELGRHLTGGFLMGAGGIFAMGCTIGQGITAFSAFAVSAPVVIVSIAIGARMGLAYLIEGSPFSPLRALWVSRGHVDSADTHR
jgi:uncharacterized protein